MITGDQVRPQSQLICDWGGSSAFSFRPPITLAWATSNSFSKGGEAMSVFITVVVQAVLIVAGVAAMGVIVLSIATQGLDGTREEEMK